MKKIKISKVLANRPKTIILLFTVVTALIGSQATNLYMISDFSDYLPRDDPSIALWNQINEEFNLGSTIIILVDQTNRLYDIRNPDVLREMDDVGRFIDQRPKDAGSKDGVVSVRSLASLIKEENAKSVLEGGNGVKTIPDDESDIYRYIQTISIKSMEGILYTNAYDIAVIIVQLSDDADFDEVLQRVKDGVENEGNHKTTMTVTGTIAMQQAIQQVSMRNLIIVFPVALILVSIVLYYFHRSFKGIIIAFLPPAFALALTFGTLGAVYPQLTMISVAIVSLLIGLGVDYSIHLMNRIAEEKDIKDKTSRIDKVLGSTGKAVLLSTVTTVIGFASLMISSMTPMVAFGFGCAIGILYCFISSIILVPCLTIILKFERVGRIPKWKSFANFAFNNRKRIFLIAAFFAVMSLILIPQIKTDVNYFDLAPEGIQEVEAMTKYSNEFGGGSNFNAMIIETDPNGLMQEDTIDAIVNMEKQMRQSIASILDIDEKNQDKLVYSIADELDVLYDLKNRSLILDFANKIFNGEEIIKNLVTKEGVVTEDFSKTLIFVSIPVGKSIESVEAAVNQINSIAEKTVIPSNGRISKLTGQDAVNVAVNKKLTDEQVRSMILALFLVLAALIVIFNSSAYGFLTMVPVIFVLMWEPGFLVAFDVPLSLVTISIAAIMVGIGIDYGVHITHRFREELKKGVSKKVATTTAIEKTGLSLVEAALTTVAGIASIAITQISAMTEFVIVIVLMVSLSCLAAALILPVFYQIKRIR